MQYLALNYTGDSFYTDTNSTATPAQTHAIFAQSQPWNAAYFILHSLEAAVLQTAKLMVRSGVYGLVGRSLGMQPSCCRAASHTPASTRAAHCFDALSASHTPTLLSLTQVLNRLLLFAFSQASPSLRRRVHTSFIIIIITIAIINTAGVCSSIVVASLTLQVGRLHADLALAYESRDTSSISRFTVAVDSQNQRTSSATSIQQFCEVTSLLLIVVTFLIAGCLCFNRLRTSSSRSSPAPELSKISRQITATVAVVFVTFLLRATFAMFNALAWALQVKTPNFKPQIPTPDRNARIKCIFRMTGG